MILLLEKKVMHQNKVISITLNFEVEDGKLFLKARKGLVQLTQEKDPTKFYSLSTLEGRSKIGSIAEIRELFNIPDYKRLTPEELKAIQ